ncbi:MAG TPA: nitrogen fixation protein NifQ [Methylocella sp.]|nr:nitrogen fixation protein NifQ [Methylocella sp.]
MKAEEAYLWLAGASARCIYDDFDIHAIASVLALAIEEADQTGFPLTEGVGLDPAALSDLARAMFPAARIPLALFGTGSFPVIDAEEQSLRDILLMYSSCGCSLERPLATMIARRCKWPHHLWQDLGLRDRQELSHLMKKYFAPLAEKNRFDMKWKKFLYRLVCNSESFTLCTSPVCSECDDFAHCFGSEEGDALLAHSTN